MIVESRMGLQSGVDGVTIPDPPLALLRQACAR